MNRFYRYTGILMLLIGLLHVTTGFIRFNTEFGRMLAAGLVDTARQPLGQRLAFWFTFAGLLMGLIGYLMDWIVRRQGMRLPGAFGYGLTGLCIIGLVLIPLSGFWLVLPLGIYLSIQQGQRA